VAVTAQSIVDRIQQDDVHPVYLVHGDVVLAEPQAMVIAQALAERAGCEVEVRHRVPTLTPLLADLRTLSLFTEGRVLMAVGSASLADASAAAALIDEVEEVLPVSADAELDARQRQAAGRLLQVLRLHSIDPDEGSPDQAVSSLPVATLKGGGRGGRRRRPRGSRQVEALRGQLADLLTAARAAGLRGWDESELADLARILAAGLPDGHALVLAESDVAAHHPIVEMLEERAAVVHLDEVAASRGGTWEGADRLATTLERETGVGMSRQALAELARRTLRKGSGSWGDDRASGDSTSRFAAEYRKLATMTAGETIEVSQVRQVVEDRGEQDIWQILDSLGAGRASEAVERYQRWLQSAEDPAAALFSFFGLLAGYCRHLAAAVGVLHLLDLPAGVSSYGRFKSRIAPAMQANLPDGSPSPLAGIHPFRLHRTYLAASRMSPARAARLPWRVLEAERRLKGGSDVPEAVMTELLLAVASGE
jgi:methylphosphotriester-DNA--protein-cysteine methyltransferase